MVHEAGAARANLYLHSYANEMAWREDNRREPNGTQYLLAPRLLPSGRFHGHARRALRAMSLAQLGAVEAARRIDEVLQPVPAHGDELDEDPFPVWLLS